MDSSNRSIRRLFCDARHCSTCSFSEIVLIIRESRQTPLEPIQSRESRTYPCGDLVEERSLLLEQAVNKVAICALQVGVTPEDIISLLDSGMSITELLAFLASKPSGIA